MLMPIERGVMTNQITHHISRLGAALIALVAFGAIASASAFAEGPEITPTPTEAAPLTFEGTGGAATLQGTKTSNAVTATAVRFKGKFTSQDKGKGTVEFSGVKSAELGKCNSPGQASGVVLFEGEVQLVDVLPTSTLDLGWLVVPHQDGEPTKDLTFVCGGVAMLVFLGSVIGVTDNSAGTLLTSPSSFTSATEYKVLFKQSAQGKQEILACMLLKATCLNAEGKEINFHLECDYGLGHELCVLVANVALKFGGSGTLTF
jgi:hypothetical protein